MFNFFANNIKISVGNGNRVKFWFDKWCGDVCFKEKFLRLFRVSNGEAVLYGCLLRRKVVQMFGSLVLGGIY